MTLTLPASTFHQARRVQTLTVWHGSTSVGPPRKLGPAFCCGGGTGLAREPSLQGTDGAPPFGGDPGRNFGSDQPETSVEGSPIGRDGLAGSRKDTGATLPSFQAIPEGVAASAKASSGFCFLWSALRLAPCAYRKRTSLRSSAFSFQHSVLSSQLSAFSLALRLPLCAYRKRTSFQFSVFRFSFSFRTGNRVAQYRGSYALCGWRLSGLEVPFSVFEVLVSVGGRRKAVENLLLAKNSRYSRKPKSDLACTGTARCRIFSLLRRGNPERDTNGQPEVVLSGKIRDRRKLESGSRQPPQGGGRQWRQTVTGNRDRRKLETEP